MLKSYHNSQRNRPMTNQHSTTLLRRRMIEDMTMRKLNPKTQSAYIRAVRKLAQFLDRSPDTATAQVPLKRGGLQYVAVGGPKI